MFDLAKKRIHEMRVGKRRIDSSRPESLRSNPVLMISGLLNNCIACTIFRRNLIFRRM